MPYFVPYKYNIEIIFFTQPSLMKLCISLSYGEHKVMLKFQMHMSSNMLLSVETFNVEVTF
jgi:hypothetical protein